MSRLAPSLRAVLALLLSLLVIVESAGVARAMGRGATVSCCCGRHAMARPCTCLSCPSRRHRAAVHEHQGDAAVAATGSCTPANEAGALLVVATPVAAPTLAPPRFLSELVSTAPSDPLSVQLETARPPP